MNEISADNNVLKKQALAGTCHGCRNKPPTFNSKIVNAVKSVSSFAKYVTSNARVDSDVLMERKTACANCQAKDSSGERLFRVGIFKKNTCGKFFMQQPVRDPKVDGCGCLLDAKWSVPEESCPLGVWGAVEAKDSSVRKRDLDRTPEGFEYIKGIPAMGTEFSVPLTLSDGRRILLGVHKIVGIRKADDMVGIDATAVVESYGKTFFVKERAEDIQAAIDSWESPSAIVPITLAELQKLADERGLAVTSFTWPLARFGIARMPKSRVLASNLRFVRNVPEVLDQLRDRLVQHATMRQLKKGV